MVFADIGTSVYYVPGILWGDVGRPAAAFVAITGLCFILLARKYVEITGRYVDGGGVVSAATEAFGPMVGALGGMLITVDYFLTSSISAVSGFEYVSSMTDLGGAKIWLTALAMVLLGVLNVIGLRESAFFSTFMAVAALFATLLTAAGAAWEARPEDWQRILSDLGSVRGLPPLKLLEGFAGAWLAFSGLESMSQLSPALRSPKNVVAARAMILVTLTILATSPILTAFSVALLDTAHTNPDQFIAALGHHAGGHPLQALVVITASALLLFASNTAIIGCYHVFVAVTRERFLPATLARVGQKFGTPHNAIALAVVVPVTIVFATQGSLTLLGHLYAFGLLGAFTLSSLSMDVVAWREKRRGFGFALGLLTTALVGAAWGANLFFKVQSTVFGVTLVGMGMALAFTVRKGWVHGEVNLVPFLTAEGAESAAESHPTMRKILTLQEAQDLLAVYPSGVLVPVRGFRPALLDAAVELARKRADQAVHLLFVDEVPGLFYPPKVGPSAEGIRTMARCSQYVEQKGVAAVPVWRLSHDASASIASAARKLETKVVMVGASERNALWTVLRGSVIRGLLEKLDKSVELVVADTGGKSGGGGAVALPR
ncbi:MAG: universal stress protein [Deltaproteobacteria bacterium]|nr:universal stress protein [Deltaproteobacteria bacterium]